MQPWGTTISALLLSFALLSAMATPYAYAGDEDVAEVKQPSTPPTPAIVPAPTPPPAPEAQPELSAGKVAPSPLKPLPAEPEDTALQPESAPPPPPAKYDPDKNIMYPSVDAEPLENGVLPPSLGFRGYRPNMIALGAGDRTPGLGGILEYNWNRLGAGIAYSYRLVNAYQNTFYVQSQSFANVYGLYRWLPFDASPYILLGGELGWATDDGVGAIAGMGLELHIYSGLTAILGYTYHSCVHMGFMGGSIGWSF